MWSYLWLVPLGFAVGAYGTLIGAGGGFVLVPILLLLYPEERPETIASISLAAVFFNALAGSLAYARMGRVDYRSGLLFSAATIPGAVLGALTTGTLPRHAFEVMLGLLMLGTSVVLIIGPASPVSLRPRAHALVVRRVMEADGAAHTFSYDPVVGVSMSLLVGYFSSALGIGGGIIHVPVLTKLLNFPVHIATATSQLTLAVMALAGSLVHVATGAFHRGMRRTVALTIGVLLGAPLGAWLSSRIRGQWIVRALAIALAIVGLRLLIGVE
ncbi:MAG TPA: sulfite exporter TauE/SafE family protein [Methylomirabilota bacterium]|nr:sulfite exporter TauE/SafE family protein [Methylomirabilota bacterium]